MTGDHPTDWPTRYIKAEALREAADEMRTAGWHRAAEALDDRADEIEQL